MDKYVLESEVNSGHSISEISKKYGVGKTTIRYYLKKYSLKTNKKPKYSNIDWNECQSMYDNGMTWRELQKKYPSNSISWAVKNGFLKLRTSSEAAKLSWKVGKQKSERYQTEEHRKKKSKFGGLKEKSGRCKKYLYTKKDGTKVWLQGSWELNLAIFFDQRNIQWDKNKNGFPYKFENKDRKYYPDFYVLGKYIEVKGYQTNQDIEKWKQFQYPLIILKKEGMKDLDTWYQQNFLKS